jgi:hypothetical protein
VDGLAHLAGLKIPAIATLPGRLRSTIKERSNSAAAPKTWSMNREAGLRWSVSRPWVTAMKRTP